MKIIVDGGSGRMGSQAVERLGARGHAVLAASPNGGDVGPGRDGPNAARIGAASFADWLDDASLTRHRQGILKPPGCPTARSLRGRH